MNPTTSETYKNIAMQFRYFIQVDETRKKLKFDIVISSS